jgi:hypothetical protein
MQPVRRWVVKRIGDDRYRLRRGDISCMCRRPKLKNGACLKSEPSIR